MKSKANFLVVLTLSVLVAACSSEPPATTVNFPSTQSRVVPERYYLPPPGQWTVRDVLQVYGKNSVDKLGFYFKKAGVAYPPREVVLIAYKQEKRLELWGRNTGDFHFIRDYFVMAASGDPGPKLHQGDRQVPEGIYRITDLNPNSRFHLSMKLNYPNQFDLIHAELDGRSQLGSDIFIHGKHASIGCIAVGDAAIRELFVMTAQVGVANVKVVIAPHDPRYYPLVADTEEMPEWTSELYAMISNEIQAVSKKTKLTQPKYNLNGALHSMATGVDQ